MIDEADTGALDGSTSADAALRQIHRELFRRLRDNEDGVRRRLSGDFLHDFRVAVRRTRTALRQVKRVYPKAAADRFAQEFRWLSDTTSPARDLEVYLASITEYGAILGDRTVESLGPFLAYLREDEDRERARCTEALESSRYRRLGDEWARFLSDPPGDEAAALPANASRPILEVAAPRIVKAFDRVLKRGGPLRMSSPPAAFHRLRLDCKKLRYLLEFFGQLFGDDGGAGAIEALRATQDALGKINDLRVQAKWLQRFPGPTDEATRSLAAFLEDAQSSERAVFLDSFAALTAPGERNAIERFVALTRRCATSRESGETLPGN